MGGDMGKPGQGAGSTQSITVDQERLSGWSVQGKRAKGSPAGAPILHPLYFSDTPEKL